MREDQHGNEKNTKARDFFEQLVPTAAQYANGSLCSSAAGATEGAARSSSAIPAPKSFVMP